MRPHMARHAYRHDLVGGGRLQHGAHHLDRPLFLSSAATATPAPHHTPFSSRRRHILCPAATIIPDTAAATTTPTPFISALHFSTTTRRHFLDSFRKAPPRELKEQLVEPGYDVLLQFRASAADDTRPPPRADLIQAFRDFFTYKYQYGKRVNATQAEWFRRLFAYLLEEATEDVKPGAGEGLTLEDLRTAREALSKPSTDRVATCHDHLGLCRAIYAEIQLRGAGSALDFKRHITILCQYGAAMEASELLASYWISATASQPHPTGGQQLQHDNKLSLLVLRGLANEGHEEALLAEAASAEAAGLEYTPVFHEIMTTFYARQNNFAKVRTWFERPIHGQLLATAQTYMQLLAFAQRGAGSGGPSGSSSATTEAQTWVQARFQFLCDANPPKDLWDVIFQWAVVALGKGVDEVRHMIATMAKHNANRFDMMPDAATLNGLISVAAARGDVLLAERFVQLGADLDIAPDAHTFVLQLGYRVDANDLSGAYASFMHLQGIDCPDDEDAPVINKYVRALCAVAQGSNTSSSTSSNSRDDGILRGTQRLRDVLETVEQRQIALEPATVVSLCLVFLANDQQYDVIDVLSVHAMQFSVGERAVVRDAFVEYIAGPVGGKKKQAPGIGSVSTARAWDAYSLLRQYFAETPAACRVRVMDAFFRRRRPDMACFVFGHMRSANDPALRPTADMYVRCLEGLGRYPDDAGLQMVHNMLKMDTRIQLDTRLYNALMLAYAASGDRSRALDFWHEISASTAGPSYASLSIVFWVCEGLPYGDTTARSVWAKLQRMEIDVPPAVIDAYAGALAGQSHVEDVKQLLTGMEKSMGYGPTMAT